MRSVLVAALFVTISIAGCVEDDEMPTPVFEDPLAGVAEPGAVFDAAGLFASHPGYQFGVNEALFESPDGRLYDDLADGSRRWYKTPAAQFDAINALEPLGKAPNATTGGGIAVLGGLAFIGGRGAGPLFVIDVMDPAEPKLLAELADVPVRDADTILFPDGRLIVISTSGGRSVVATDATDPYNPIMIGVFEQVGDENVSLGSGHNIAVVPGAPIVYNSGMDIIDFSVPENPVYVGRFPNGDGCHDIAFHIDNEAGKQWALCAGYAHTEIWDIADPLAPVLIVEIDYPSAEKGLPVVGGTFDDLGVPQDVLSPVDDALPCVPTPAPVPNPPCSVSGAVPLSFSHLAIVNHDATVLIMGDETGGGGGNYCDFYIDGGEAGTMSGPVGNLWFYDISDPKDPDLRGHVSPGYMDAEGSCTAHFGKIIEDSGFLVMGFYSAGITLVDFRDLDNPRIVDRLDQGGSIWDVWYHQGYLFTGDISRGMDTIKLN